MMTTIPMPPSTLGARGVGLSGPIGATVDGTTATGTVDTVWPTVDLPSLPGLPALDVGGGIAAAVLFLAVLVAVVVVALVAPLIPRRH